MVEAQEVAREALFLWAGNGRPITGEVFRVDAGWGVAGA
jgi:enoyl-[acyl-carrier-protein] reductase (NADH)